VAVFCLASINTGRAGVILTEWGLWTEFDLPFPLPLRVALSVLWGALLAGLAWGLWTMRRWSRRWMLIFFPLYQFYEIGWYLAFVRSDYERGRLPFVLVVTTLTTLVVVWILTQGRMKQRFELGRKSEENSG
jgi:hypothetical protein